MKLSVIGSVLEPHLVKVLMKFMRPFSRIRHLVLAGLTLSLASGLVSLPIKMGSSEGNIDPVLAQSGGRTRGGSFDRPAAPESAPAQGGSYGGGYGGGGYGGGGYGGGYSSPYDYSVPYNDPYYPSRPDYFPGSYRRPRVIVLPPQSYPVPVDSGYGYGTSSSSDGLFLILVILLGSAMLPVIMSYLRQAGRQGTGNRAAGELNNDTVTVTQLQVALLAQARYIQEALTQLSLQANLETQAGLTELLRETVLALLRSPENWTHARVDSQTIQSRTQASQVFEQLSIQERSKLSAETLVNVGGKIRRQAVQVNKDADPASYIVVTLLLGTADDRPLAQSVHSAEELQVILKRLGSVAPSYLLIFELIWTPQDASDSLSRDQLLTLYPDLIQIA